MAIEYFAGDLAATAAEMAYDVASNISNNLGAVAEEYAADKRSQAAFRRGINLAERRWQPELEKALIDGREYSSRYVSAGQKIAALQRRLRKEVKERIYLDCQRFGYSEAIGMLKAFCDYSNWYEKDHRGKLVHFDKYYHHTGENVSLYEEPTVTNLRLSDFPDINDEAHKHVYKKELEEGRGILSVYEECYLKGFWYRATQLWKKAEAENDTIALEAMESLRTMKSRCFWQHPDIVRELYSRQKEGYEMVKEKMIPYWDEEIEKRTAFIKENNLSSDEVVSMQMKYHFFEDKIRDKIQEEQKRYAEKGIDKQYFI